MTSFPKIDDIVVLQESIKESDYYQRITYGIDKELLNQLIGKPTEVLSVTKNLYEDVPFEGYFGFCKIRNGNIIFIIPLDFVDASV